MVGRAHGLRVFGQAQFEVTVQYPGNMVALSNTPAVAGYPGSKDGTFVQRFDRTPVMSPYLLAVCVGILKNRTMTSEGFLYQVVGWATPDLEWQLDTGMQVRPPAHQLLMDNSSIEKLAVRLEVVWEL